MAKTINQARAAYKSYFKADADDKLTVEEIASAIDTAKAKVAEDKAAANKKKLTDAAKVQADAQAAADLKAAQTAAKKPKYKAIFPKVEIPKMGVFTADELEANPEICEHLLEIGSPAVVKL